MGLCGSKAAPACTVEDPALINQQRSQEPVDPGAEARQPPATAPSLPEEAAIAAEQESSAGKAAALAAAIVTSVVEEAISGLVLAESEVVARTLVDEILNSCLASGFTERSASLFNSVTGPTGLFDFAWLSSASMPSLCGHPTR